MTNGRGSKYFLFFRAAAARCRQKRKVWVNNLESKADNITTHNQRLQNEVNSLRGEVAKLKSLLLAHKDCDIFIQQRNNGQIKLDDTPSTHRHIVKTMAHSAPKTVAIGPNVSRTTSILMPANSSTTQNVGLALGQQINQKVVSLAPGIDKQNNVVLLGHILKTMQPKDKI